MMELIHGGVRFVPTRAGIINLWDYRDEEFLFVDGWLVLRGPNGSGKTKALEVLFPFVLDGRIDPKRLNPFAAEDRTMKSNLLFRGQDSALGYVWIEFTHRETGEAVTCGPPDSRHSISSSPPSSTSVALRALRPRLAAATRAAQAPVPQAWVSPAPRSQTRRRMRSPARIWAKPTLTASGNSG